MGRIKLTYVKRIGEELMEKYPKEFSKQFDENKKKVGELTTVQSKSIRNKIAGYMIRIVEKAEAAA